MDFPKELKYTENDEWVRIEGQIGTTGLTDYAQDQLSDIVYLEIVASVGSELSQGEVFAEVESVKAAAEAYAPVDMMVTEVNEAVSDAPETINADPYGKAWMIRYEIQDPSQLEGLMDDEAYEEHCKSRE